MAGSGPPPNPNAKRRNARVGVVVLPAGGYQGAIPDWPLLPDVVTTAKRDMERRSVEEARAELENDDEDLTPAKRRAIEKRLRAADLAATILDAQIDAQIRVESELWRQLWRTPQAREWARLGWGREVAQYARHKARGEMGSLDDSKEARMLSDRLGLNPKAMRSLMWVVSADEVGEKRDEHAAAPKAATGKRRLRAVDKTGS